MEKIIENLVEEITALADGGCISERLWGDILTGCVPKEMLEGLGYGDRITEYEQEDWDEDWD